MITVYFDKGQSFFLTSLISVGPKGIILDYGSDEDVNRRALKADRLLCTTSVDKVKVQFALENLSLITHEGRPAFFSELPKTCCGCSAGNISGYLRPLQPLWSARSLFALQRAA